MKRFQIGLRLLLLMVALLAACFAWQGAIRSRARAERAVERWNLEARLAAEVRWRAALRRELQTSTSPSVRGSVAGQLPAVESRLAAMRKALAGSLP